MTLNSQQMRQLDQIATALKVLFPSGNESPTTIQTETPTGRRKIHFFEALTIFTLIQYFVTTDGKLDELTKFDDSRHYFFFSKGLNDIYNHLYAMNFIPEAQLIRAYLVSATNDATALRTNYTDAEAKERLSQTCEHAIQYLRFALQVL